MRCGAVRSEPEATGGADARSGRISSQIWSRHCHGGASQGTRTVDRVWWWSAPLGARIRSGVPPRSSCGSRETFRCGTPATRRCDATQAVRRSARIHARRHYGRDGPICASQISEISRRVRIQSREPGHSSRGGRSFVETRVRSARLADSQPHSPVETDHRGLSNGHRPG